MNCQNVVSNYKVRVFGTILFIGFVCYYFVLRNVHPGYFDPITPHHADFYMRAPFDSEARVTDIFLQPRFVSFFIIRSISELGLDWIISFLILLTLINLSLTIYYVKTFVFAANGKFYWPTIILYFISVFANPTFYFNYTYDGNDTVAYFFFLLSVLVWQQFKQNKEPHFFRLTIAFAFLCFFSKETYYITYMLFIIWEALDNNSAEYRKFVIRLAGFAIAFIGGAFAHSHLTNSKWVQPLGSPDNPYYIDLNLYSIVKIYNLYASTGICYLGLTILALGLCFCYLTKERCRSVIFLGGLGLSVYLPYSILPNHVFPAYYSWLGVPLFYAILLVINPDTLEKKFNNIKPIVLKKLITPFLAFLAAVLIVFNLIFFKSKIYPGSWWLLQQETIQRNILLGLAEMKNSIRPSDRVLILGLYVPFHPFVHNNFIAHYFGDIQITKWTVAIEKENVLDTSGVIIYQSYSSIDISDFDQVFLFSTDGVLRQELTESDIRLFLSDMNRNAKLDRVLSQIGHPSEWPTFLIIGHSALNYGNLDKAEYYLTQSNQFTSEKNGRSLFYLGETFFNKKNTAKSYECFDKALKLSKTDLVLEREVSGRILQIRNKK